MCSLLTWLARGSVVSVWRAVGSMCMPALGAEVFGVSGMTTPAMGSRRCLHPSLLASVPNRLSLSSVIGLTCVWIFGMVH